MRREIALAVALFLAGCGHVIPADLTADGKPFDFAQVRECAPASDPNKVEVRYLGSGGVYIRWRNDAILLGPSFSNPGVLRAGLWLAAFDEKRVARAMRSIDRTKVRAILAGHSHYDHIGDLPLVASEQSIPTVPIWVNESGANMLHAYEWLRPRVRRIDPQTPIVVSPSIVVRAVPSTHAPQLCPLRIFPCVYAPGEVRTPWTREWRWHFLRSFRGGQTYAFVIELRDKEKEYRIYYNDSAAGSPAGQATGEFDLAILAMAQWNFVRDYPRHLLEALRPRHVIVSHWDNFFRKDEGRSRFVPTMSNRNAARFLRIVNEEVKHDAGPTNSDVCGVKNEAWTMPVVGATMLFEPRVVRLESAPPS